MKWLSKNNWSLGFFNETDLLTQHGSEIIECSYDRQTPLRYLAITLRLSYLTCYAQLFNLPVLFISQILDLRSLAILALHWNCFNFFFNLKLLLNSWDFSRGISLRVLASQGTNFHSHTAIMARSAPLSSCFLVRRGWLYIDCLKRHCNIKYLNF